MEKLNNLLNQLEAKIALSDVTNQQVSEAKIGWHIEHSLLVINGIIKTLSKSNPSDYKWKFSLAKFIIFTTGNFPRGKAKAPKSATPEADFTKESLTAHLTKVRERVIQLDTMSSDAFFKHPYFGDLKLKQAIRFIEIHTNHHLKIINDIGH